MGFTSSRRKWLSVESLPHFVWSTAGNDRRNHPNDVDVILYSLKKWAALSCKGNPTALHFLFSAGVLHNKVWKKIVASRCIFLARVFVKQFLGFADDQLERMTGTKGRGRKGHRPEIQGKYGYDVKAAMRTLCLLFERKELLSAGAITLPRPERDFLIRVCTGEYSVDKVLDMAQKLFADCKDAARLSPLREPWIGPLCRIFSLILTAKLGRSEQYDGIRSGGLWNRPCSKILPPRSSKPCASAAFKATWWAVACVTSC